MLTKPRPKRICLTFDAFGTLFHPREPIGKQYADIARQHGLFGFTDKEMGASFLKAFKRHSEEQPNYGKVVGTTVEKWWGDVIHTTLLPFTSCPLPPALIPTLLTHFSSSAGYTLYPDVLPFFHRLRHLRHSVAATSPSRTPSPTVSITTGIITNSDTRIPLILSSLGLLTPPTPDIDFITTSYETGFSKPHRGVFDVASEVVGRMKGWREGEYRCVHVGDERGKDVQGAKGAGWEGVWLDREGVGGKEVCENGKGSIASLESLWERVVEG